MYPRRINHPEPCAFTDRSGTTTATTSVTVMAANASRQYVFFQNVSDTDMWIDFGTAATNNQPSMKITPGSSFVMEGSVINTSSVLVYCTASSKAFTAKEA